MGKRLGEYTHDNTKCMLEVNGTKLPDNKANFTLTFEVDNVKGLDAIQYRIRCISGVLDVRRGQR